MKLSKNPQTNLRNKTIQGKKIVESLSRDMSIY